MTKTEIRDSLVKQLELRGMNAEFYKDMIDDYVYYWSLKKKCICVIDGAQHEIYNVAHVTTKDGFKETELTLKTPAYDREVYDDETGTQ